MSRRTLWTGSGMTMAATAFVMTMLLIEGTPTAGRAEPPLAVAAPVRTVTPAVAATPVDQRFVLKRILPIDGPIRYGEWHWDEAGVPAGPLVVTVDLKANVMSVFRDGYEIGATAVLLGWDDKPTPTGVFPISQKKRHHVSNLYDAPMPYMLRLTDDGITIHATKVENGYVTRGCIGVPEGFARKLFGAASLGDRVIVTDGETMQLGDSIV